MLNIFGATKIRTKEQSQTAIQNTYLDIINSVPGIQLSLCLDVCVNYSIRYRLDKRKWCFCVSFSSTVCSKQLSLMLDLISHILYQDVVWFVCVWVMVCFKNQHLVALCITMVHSVQGNWTNWSLYTLDTLSHSLLLHFYKLFGCRSDGSPSFLPAHRFTTFHYVHHYYCDGLSLPSTCQQLLEMTLFMVTPLLNFSSTFFILSV